MRRQDMLAWMLTEAVDQLERADRLQRRRQRTALTCWEPAVDIVAGPQALRVVVALPGLTWDRLDVAVEASAIVVRGERPFASDVLADEILCLEIPYGPFERRIPLPDGIYRLADMQLADGYLRLHLERLP